MKTTRRQKERTRVRGSIFYYLETAVTKYSCIFLSDARRASMRRSSESSLAASTLMSCSMQASVMSVCRVVVMVFLCVGVSLETLNFTRIYRDRDQKMRIRVRDSHLGLGTKRRRS